ncbi:rod shape-determining protein MreC [Desulfovibrio ferrophilus]|uniref:rod shape-determining protein MreC n=1 Tax=Desulfovibrio ferrophilus TaxID=241368 RepID=UPI001E370D8E|nr:rod shape-determining protein MreC [Desulfovibrio ferrophilus]
MASRTGLEFVGWVIKPGRWIADQATTTWKRYLYLVDLRQENDLLRERLDQLTMELTAKHEQVTEAFRLRKLLGFRPPMGWTSSGARVIAQRMGPNAALGTVVIDKGTLADVDINTPVITPHGVVGRVLRSGLTASSVLLLTDHNSKIPVLGMKHRSTGILTGGGADNSLDVYYVPLNAPIDEGEILLTSGLAEIYPKGLPIARVTSVERSEISLFLTVRAEPLVNLRDLEEILLLQTQPAQAPNVSGSPAAAPGS